MGHSLVGIGSRMSGTRFIAHHNPVFICAFQAALHPPPWLLLVHRTLVYNRAVASRGRKAETEVQLTRCIEGVLSPSIIVNQRLEDLI